MITKLIFKELKQDEYIFLVNTIILQSKRVELLPVVKKEVEHLDNLYEKLMEVRSFVKSKRYTGLLTTIDQQRDTTLVGIRQIARGYAHSTEEAQRKAGELILKSLNRIGKNLENDDRKGETGGIMMLTASWENVPAYHEALALLHLKDWKERLIQFNANYRAAYQEKLSLEMTRPQYTMVQVRRESEQCIRRLFRALEAQQLMQPSEELDGLIKLINITIKKYKQELAVRKARAKAKREKQKLS